MQYAGKPLNNPNKATSQVGVSPETIAQQFCHVASDMRALLKETQNTKEQLANSIEIQQGMASQIEDMNGQIGKMTESVKTLTERMLDFMDVMKDFIDHNHVVVDELTENTLVVAAAYRPKDDDLSALLKRVQPHMEKKRAEREGRIKDRRAHRELPA